MTCGYVLLPRREARSSFVIVIRLGRNILLVGWGQIRTLPSVTFTCRCALAAVMAALVASSIPAAMAARIAAGNNHSLWIKNDGSLWAWGDNASGRWESEWESG